MDKSDSDVSKPVETLGSLLGNLTDLFCPFAKGSCLFRRMGQNAGAQFGF